MQKLEILIATLCLLMVGSGCETGNGETSSPSDESAIQLQNELHYCYLEADATKSALQFEIDHDWAIRFVTYDGQEVNWIKASPSSGQAGRHLVELTLEPNYEIDSRLVRAEVVRTDLDATRMEEEDMVATYRAITFAASFLQFGYYKLEYGDPIELHPTKQTRLQTLVDEYIAKHEKRYSDIIYLELSGTLNEEDFKFISENLTRLKIVDMFRTDITEIPHHAFFRLYSLHYVVLPQHLKSIGDYAFCQSELKNINLFIPPTLQYVGYNAFADTLIAGTLIFPGTQSHIHLSAGAFHNEYLSSAVFCEGISSLSGDIASPFSDILGTLYLPSTLGSVDCGFITNVAWIYCYPVEPPATDIYGIGIGDIKGLFVPNTTVLTRDNKYAEKWPGFYSEIEDENKLFDCL